MKDDRLRSLLLGNHIQRGLKGACFHWKLIAWKGGRGVERGRAEVSIPAGHSWRTHSLNTLSYMLSQIAIPRTKSFHIIK